MREVSVLNAAADCGFIKAALCAPGAFERWNRAQANAHPSARRLNQNPAELYPDARALLIAAWPYALYRREAPAEAAISAYYAQGDAANAASERLLALLREGGIDARLAEGIPLKTAAARAGLGRYGRNALICVEGAGSLVMLRGFVLGEGFEAEAPLPSGDDAAGLDCGACTRCRDACPTGAIDEAGVDYTRCLRAWMQQGKPVPPEICAAMGNRLLGCEECLRACPHNAKRLAGSAADDANIAPLRDVGALLRAGSRADYLARFGAALGYNYSNPNRLLTQGLIVAANTGRAELLPCIAQLSQSASDAVRASANFALQKLSSRQ